MDVRINETLGYILRKEKIFSLIKACSIKQFMDIGCGVGHFMHELLESGAHGDGMDISTESLEVARQVLSRYSDVHLYNSWNGIPWDSYSHIFLLEVLEHTEDDRELLVRIKQKMHQQAMLILSVPANQRYYGQHDVMCGHVRRYDYQYLKELLEKAGFQIIKISGYGPYILPLREPYLHWKAKRNLRRNHTSPSTDGTSLSGLYLIDHHKTLFDKTILSPVVAKVLAFPFNLMPEWLISKQHCLGFIAMVR
jgi:SAM-dependent methyltransferase